MSKRIPISLASCIVVLGFAACNESPSAPGLIQPQDARTSSTVCKRGYPTAVDPSNADQVAADVNLNGTVCVTKDLSFNTKRQGSTVYSYADDVL
jgi:hypothetical protein